MTEKENAEFKGAGLIAADMAKWPWKPQLGLSKGFYAVKVHPTATPCIGIGTDNRGFHYKSLPMGVRNGPAVFAKWTAALLRGISQPCFTEMTFLSRDRLRSSATKALLKNSAVPQCVTTDGKRKDAGHVEKPKCWSPASLPSRSRSRFRSV